jgi:nitroreductase
MNIEDVNELIQGRQSLYPMQMEAGARIPDEAIWQLLTNANYAPSHKRTEPWRFIVFPKEKLLHFYSELGNIYQRITPETDFNPATIEKLNKRAESLSHVIVICMKRDPDKRVPVQEEEYAVACAVQNILLSMKPLNIIGYWGTGKVAFSKEMKEFLGLGKEDKCMGFLQLGVPKKDLPSIPKSQMSPIQEKVKWI